MEYVQGQPIDAYCREQGLSVELRLRLFTGLRGGGFGGGIAPRLQFPSQL